MASSCTQDGFIDYDSFDYLFPFDNHLQSLSQDAFSDYAFTYLPFSCATTAPTALDSLLQSDTLSLSEALSLIDHPTVIPPWESEQISPPETPSSETTPNSHSSPSISQTFSLSDDETDASDSNNYPTRSSSSQPNRSPVMKPASPETPPSRKRGRPPCSSVLNRPKSGVAKARIAHNLVERKYRQGINSQIDRLRRCVPTLQRLGSDGDENGMIPSKAAIIAAAVDYIKSIEGDRDVLIRRWNIIKSRIALAR